MNSKIFFPGMRGERLISILCVVLCKAPKFCNESVQSQGALAKTMRRSTIDMEGGCVCDRMHHACFDECVRAQCATTMRMSL